MPVVLRGGMLEDRPALVPAALAVTATAHVPRRFGTAGWIAATALCALSVYAVRDTMFAPLAQSEAPSSAWETRVRPGDTTPPLIAAPGTVHVDLEDHDPGTDGTSATGTTVADVDPGRPSTGGSEVSPNGNGGGASTAATSPSTPGDAASTASSADPTTSSSPSTSTPDTLGGHGADSGGSKGGSGTGSGSP
jgi:hypothetical protein